MLFPPLSVSSNAVCSSSTKFSMADLSSLQMFLMPLTLRVIAGHFKTFFFYFLFLILNLLWIYSHLISALLPSVESGLSCENMPFQMIKYCHRVLCLHLTRATSQIELMRVTLTL